MRNHTNECKICSLCDNVIDPWEMAWIEVEEFAPIGEYEEPIFLVFHSECIREWFK
jgi:hypothetical protein